MNEPALDEARAYWKKGYRLARAANKEGRLQDVAMVLGLIAWWRTEIARLKRAG